MRKRRHKKGEKTEETTEGQTNVIETQKKKQTGPIRKEDREPPGHGKGPEREKTDAEKPRRKYQNKEKKRNKRAGNTLNATKKKSQSRHEKNEVGQ